MLEITKLTRRFPNGTTAFQDLSLRVGKSEILGILGTSGCGKSTLLRAISGLDRAEGRIELNGRPINGLNPETGIVFQEPRLLPWLTVEKNVDFGLEVLSLDRREKRRRRDYWLEKVGLVQAHHLYPKECSGGMAQRAALARTLATGPELLLLDEPFSALDAFIRMQLQDLLLEVWEEAKSTIVLVTHDVDEALYLCDRIVVLRGQPGTIAREFVIPQRRPRARGDIDLARMKEWILDVLNLKLHVPRELQYNI